MNMQLFKNGQKKLDLAKVMKQEEDQVKTIQMNIWKVQAMKN